MSCGRVCGRSVVSAAVGPSKWRFLLPTLSVAVWCIKSWLSPVAVGPPILVVSIAHFVAVSLTAGQGVVTAGAEMTPQRVTIVGPRFVGSPAGQMIVTAGAEVTRQKRSNVVAISVVKAGAERTPQIRVTAIEASLTSEVVFAISCGGSPELEVSIAHFVGRNLIHSIVIVTSCCGSPELEVSIAHFIAMSITARYGVETAGAELTPQRIVTIIDNIAVGDPAGQVIVTAGADMTPQKRGIVVAIGVVGAGAGAACQRRKSIVGPIAVGIPAGQGRVTAGDKVAPQERGVVCAKYRIIVRSAPLARVPKDQSRVSTIARAPRDRSIAEIKGMLPSGSIRSKVRLLRMWIMRLRAIICRCLTGQVRSLVSTQ